MAFLLDTSILVRLANVSDAQHSLAVQALLELHRRGEVLHVTPQVLIEFRNVATRPRSLNGAGLPVADAESHAAAFEGNFPLLADTPDIYPAWKGLVSALSVIGKQVHDARLVAVCHVHGVMHLLTFNVGHFTRLATFGPGVVVVDPQPCKPEPAEHIRPVIELRTTRSSGRGFRPFAIALKGASGRFSSTRRTWHSTRTQGSRPTSTS